VLHLHPLFTIPLNALHVDFVASLSVRRIQQESIDQSLREGKGDVIIIHAGRGVEKDVLTRSKKIDSKSDNSGSLLLKKDKEGVFRFTSSVVIQGSSYARTVPPPLCQRGVLEYHKYGW
jgi:hypothetical protein